MRVSIEEIRAGLGRDGYYVGHAPLSDDEAAPFVLDVAGSLGELYVPADCDPAAPIIRSAPTRRKRAAPFDRPEAIGWHGDFATHEARPELSLSYITRADPRGGMFGAWRLASVGRVIATLRVTPEGRAALDLLSREPLSFSYADGEPPRPFLVIERGSAGNQGLRFYLPSIRRGCVTMFGGIPPNIEAALVALERAADQVAEIVTTRNGSFLVASNWFALHDRTHQTVSRTRQNREALLCFVAHQKILPSRKQSSRVL